MSTIVLFQVSELTVGSGCVTERRNYLEERSIKRAFLIAPPVGRKITENLLGQVRTR